MDERLTMVTIGGKEFPMMLSVYATKQIIKRFGGLESKRLNWRGFSPELAYQFGAIALNAPLFIYNVPNQAIHID